MRCCRGKLWQTKNASLAFWNWPSVIWRTYPQQYRTIHLLLVGVSLFIYGRFPRLPPRSLEFALCGATCLGWAPVEPLCADCEAPEMPRAEIVFPSTIVTSNKGSAKAGAMNCVVVSVHRRPWFSCFSCQRGVGKGSAIAWIFVFQEFVAAVREQRVPSKRARARAQGLLSSRHHGESVVVSVRMQCARVERRIHYSQGAEELCYPLRCGRYTGR